MHARTMFGRMKRTLLSGVSLLFAAAAFAQVQVPPTSQPIGQSRLPTESNTLPPKAGVGDDCRAQSDTVREQYALQERALRRELQDREKLADESEKSRLRGELEQRVAALKVQATEAQRRVQETCRG